MKYLLFFLSIIFSGSLFAQPVVCPPTPHIVLLSHGDTIRNNKDTISCSVACGTIAAAVDSDIAGTTTYTVSSITYAPQPFTTGSNVLYFGAAMATSTSTDDAFGDIIPLPFNFCFFGTSYNQIVVGSNGNATFNTSLADAYDPWPISGPLPGSNCAATENCIMAPWNDLEDWATPGATVVYNVYGVAPCRQFVVSWANDQLFDPGICPGQYSTQQFIMYESSNIIDVYIQHRAPCTGWNSGFAVTGIENNAGTVFYTPPGENGTTFSATNLGWRFTPATPPEWNYTWKDSTGAVVGTGDSIVLCPTVNTRYSIVATNLTNCLVLNDDFSIIKENGKGIDSTGFTNPSYCEDDGSILFHGMPVGDTISVTYDFNGTSVGPVLKYPDADSNIIFPGLGAGTYDNFMFAHDGCDFGPFNFTLVAHLLSAAISVNANSVCQGTPIQFTGSSVSTDAPVYTWNFGDGSSIATGATVNYTYPIGGSYTAKLTVTDTFGCDTSAIDTFDVIAINVHTGVHDTSICFIDSTSYLPLQAIAQVNLSFVQYDYSWTPTNNINQTTTPTTDFYGIGTYMYTITVTTTAPPLVLNPGGCVASDTEHIASYPPVTFTDLTASPQVIDYGTSIQLNAFGAVYYYWTPDNGTIDNPNINNPTVTPHDTTTIYTVYGMNLFGCLDSAKITVYVNYDLLSDVPTAFTPNNDGRNDKFVLSHLQNKKLIDFRIFNRWGEEVFQTSNPEFGWDGTYHDVPQDMGVYSYQVIVGEPDGTTKTYKGTVTLIR